jgi:predicted O-methyltransferase YrrM
MYDVLCGGRFQHALEIGCLNGASSTAFVEAINGQRLRHATFCDIDLRATLQEVLKECRFPDRIQTFEGRSVDLLRQRSDFDFVFVDGDHRLETVTEEVELLLLNPPTCVMAHDTSVRVTGLDS